MAKRLISVGVLSKWKHNGVYNVIKEILIGCGYKYLYDNDILSILTNEYDFILIFQLTKKTADKIMGLNLCLDVIVDTGLNCDDYRNPSIRSLVKNCKYFIMNVDEKNSINVLDEDIKSLVITYGLNNKATVTASSLTFGNDIKFNICLQRECTTIRGNKVEPMEYPITIDLIGRLNFYNSLAAITFCLIYGISIENINDALLNVKGISAYLEKMCYKDNIIILNDCSKNCLDYNFVFEEIQYIKFNNIYVILAIDEEQEFYKIKSNLKVVFDWQPILNVKKLFLYLETNNELIIRNIASLFLNQKMDYELFSDLGKCIYSGTCLLNSGDLLLVIGDASIRNIRKSLCQLIL